MRVPLSFGVVLLLAWAGGVRAFPDPELPELLGFPNATPDTLDVRIWLGGGVVVPQTVYRIYEGVDGRVHGQVVRWLRLRDEGEHMGKRTNRRLRRLMRATCSSFETAEQLLWCERRVDKDTLNATLQDIQPEALFSLSSSIQRDCGWLTEDGEIVTIELVKGRGSHRLSLANPDFCCSEPVCAFVNHARDVVRRSMQVEWGRSN